MLTINFWQPQRSAVGNRWQTLEALAAFDNRSSKSGKK